MLPWFDLCYCVDFSFSPRSLSLLSPLLLSPSLCLSSFALTLSLAPLRFSCITTDLARNCFFGPALRFHRPRRDYAADGESAKNKKEEEGLCARTPSVHGGLGPGLLGVYCPHGICLGFSIMRKSEGEVMVFRMLYNRFECAPRVVVYDRACSTKTSCDKREPAFFHPSLFTLDALHSSNHVDCSEGFDLRVARNSSSLGSTPLFFNTQAAEQANAALRRITKSVGFMGPRQAMLYVRFFMAEYNKTKKEALAPSA